MVSGRQAVVLPNRDGLGMYGVLDMPAAPATDVGVILLSPGVKMRVGPQRLYRALTERLVGLGVPVLRFDFHGLGDSEGEVREELLKDVYNHIEVGRFVNDTIDSMDWMARTCGTRRFVLAGLCGGAITGLLTAKVDSRVAGLLALAITPVLASRSADPASYMTSGQMADMRRTYLGKLLDPGAWLRLLSFKSDYRVIWKVVAQPFRSPRQPASALPASPAAPTPSASPVGAAVSGEPADNANPLFPPAFFSMLDGQRPMLLVFGASDRLRWEYDEKFVARHRDRLGAGSPYVEVHTIADANHVLSFEPWQREMLDTSEAWMRRWFAGRDASAA